MQAFFKNDSDGNRTRVTAVKGRCLNRLTTEPYFLAPLSQCRELYYHTLSKKASLFLRIFHNYTFYHICGMFTCIRAPLKIDVDLSPCYDMQRILALGMELPHALHKAAVRLFFKVINLDNDFFQLFGMPEICKLFCKLCHLFTAADNNIQHLKGIIFNLSDIIHIDSQEHILNL